jgi:hypothetical protein
VPQNEDGTDGGASSANATHAIDAIKFCNRYITECKIEQTVTVQACIDRYTPARVTPACAAKIDSATCSDFGTAFTDLCFPKCSAAGVTCGTDTITECDANLRAHTYSCEGICSVSRARFSGTCGTTYQGEVAQDAKCWCTL